MTYHNEVDVNSAKKGQKAEEKVGPVPHAAEHVWRRASNGELPDPLRGGDKRLGECTNVLGKNFGGNH